MIYILAFIILIGVIVFVHELGHFWAARSVGGGVERFSVGMPPNFVDFTFLLDLVYVFTNLYEFLPH